MAILINDNYSLSATKPFDARYMNISTPWVDCAEVIAAIPTYRYIGLTVNIAGQEYWWKDGIADGNLVPKVLGGVSNLSGVTNGLSLFCGDTQIGLGGILTQDTTICGAYDLNLGNVASGLTSLCTVTPIFHVQNAGNDSSISFCHNQDTPHFDVCLFGDNANSCAGIILDVDINNGCFNAYTAPNSICCSGLELNTTDSNQVIFDVHSTNNAMEYQKEAWISSSCRMTCEALVNSSDSGQNIKSVMDYSGRSFVFSVDNTPVLSILSGGTARYNSCVTLLNDCDLAYKGYVDNATGGIDANNGLSREGDNIVLGGSLTGDTCIQIGTDVLDIYGSNAGLTPSVQLDGTQNSVTINGGGAIGVFDNNIVILKPAASGSDCLSMALTYTTFESTGGTGIRYAGDYENTLVDRSLVTKKYVCSQVSGITGAITTANNGLTKVGQNVVLGGALTGSTSITGGGNKNITFTNISGFSTCGATNLICATTSFCLRSPSTNINDGNNNTVISINSTCNIFADVLNSRGFVYAGNYCANGKTNPRWIPDNQYVTGLTSQALQTASNGLTKVGQNIKLGGTLTENTNICLGGLTPYSLCIRNSGTTTHTVAEFAPTIINLCARNVNSPFQTSRLTAGVSGTVMCHGYANCYSLLNMSNSLVNMTICDNTSSGSFTVTDATTDKRGIEYAACYHSSYSDRSLVDKQYVTSQVSGITGNAITGATNGLTKVGQDVVLGGTLTGNTLICGNSANLTICALTNTNISSGIVNITGSTNQCGYFISKSDCGCIQSLSDGTISICAASDKPLTLDGQCVSVSALANYDACYHGAYVPRSLVDKEYVDLQTSGITINAITGATNGLTKVGQDVILGGTLTGATTIDTDGKLFKIIGGNASSFYQVQASSSGNTFFENVQSDSGSMQASSIYQAFKPFGTEVACIQLRTNCGNNNCSLIRFYTTPSSSCLQLGIKTTGGTSSFLSWQDGSPVISDSINSKGLSYSNNYEPNFTALSLVTKKYVDDTVTGGTSAISGANGLTRVDDNITLGGALTGDTTITGAYILALNSLTAFNTTATNINLNGATTINSTLNVTGNTTLEDVLNVSGNTNLGSGLTIGSVSSGSVSDEILVWNNVDKCVKRITASGIVPTASNGLDVDGGNIVLGGTLTGDTCIDTGTNAYSLLLSTDVPQGAGCDASIYIAGNTPNSPYVSINSRNISGCGFNGYMVFSGGTIRVGKSGGSFPGVEYCGDYTANFNDCSLITKQYVDAEIISNSNTVKVFNVTSNYLATQTDDFIGVSGATEICLPTIPKPCQRIIVADICGNALNQTICIIGNGLCINGNSCATINTDYGAMTFINNGYSWSAVAFIN